MSPNVVDLEDLPAGFSNHDLVLLDDDDTSGDDGSSFAACDDVVGPIDAHHHHRQQQQQQQSFSLMPPFVNNDMDHQQVKNQNENTIKSSDGSQNVNTQRLGGSKAVDDSNNDDNEEGVLCGQTISAGREDRRMTNNLRVVVIVMMISVCVAAPLVLYFVTRKCQGETFEVKFVGLADKVATSLKVQLTLQVETLQALALSLSWYEQSRNLTWPFIDMPEWSIHAEKAKQAGGLVNVNLHPLVELDDREEYEQWVPDNLEWFQVGMALQSQAEKTFTVSSSYDSGNRHRMMQSSSNIDPADRVDDGVIPDQIFGVDPTSPTGFSPESSLDAPYLPIWMQDPIVPSSVNLNLLTSLIGGDGAAVILNTSDVVLSPFMNLSVADPTGEASLTEFLSQKHIENSLTEYLSDLLARYVGDATYIYDGEPVATLGAPVFSSLVNANGQKQIAVAVLNSVVLFEQLFNNVLPSNGGSVIVVLSNTCGDVASYQIDGEIATYIGHGDLHDPEFDSMRQLLSFSDLSTELNMNSDFCAYSLIIYPTDDLHEEFDTNVPLAYSLTFAFILLFFAIILFAYDYLLRRRLKRVIKSARNNRAIVSSLFPANVRDRLLQEEEDRKQRQTQTRHSSLASGSSHHDVAEYKRRLSNDMYSRRRSNEGRRNSNENETGFSRRSSMVQGVSSVVTQSVNVAGSMAGYLLMAPSKFRLRSYLTNDVQTLSDTFPSDKSSVESMNIKPIADLFPSCTVLFADISGFTAWSSEREPEQVFTLLQEFFQCFDSLAKQRKVFKVETIGDCYVAVTGLPDPQPDHAVRMTKFARACMQQITEITERLEVSLGPGTGDLRMRFGLHSGPVTAGVLRGEKSRFQLFGDTVNTASRMESTGQRNRIQVSQQTADLLIEAGKSNWITPRRDLVECKGKGQVQTFWALTRRQTNRSASCDSNDSSRLQGFHILTDSSDRHDTERGDSDDESVWHDEEAEMNASTSILLSTPGELCSHYERLIDWQVELFSGLLKKVLAGRNSVNVERLDPSAILNIDGPVFEQVTDSIALPDFDAQAARARVRKSESITLSVEVVFELRSFIRDIAKKYHNNPFHSYAHASHVLQSANKLLGRISRPEDVNYNRKSVKAIASDLHTQTYGITSDPLTHFGILFATLIHDVDHTGCSNPQRGKEEPELADKYKNRSVAEQNSVDLAWQLLMKYDKLQACIWSNADELSRFRQLVVNLVMATDIFDKDLKSTRNARWDKIFHTNMGESVEGDEFRNLKAAIVIEHIIQAADVSHTMQHWHIYKKWNERLFQEMTLAYEEGRGGAKHPSDGWYAGELWFFDNYVIPLAKKLEECRVFGVSSDECLNYALENRKEWAIKGKQIVEDMKLRFNSSKHLRNRPIKTGEAVLIIKEDDAKMPVTSKLEQAVSPSSSESKSNEAFAPKSRTDDEDEDDDSVVSA